ncbi:MAG: PDZ domain-containing protein [candidate division WOR-3 bacterium]|nr:MAG: PDZ domain-containing protein [candidate division WOR-3 bacterium]
MKLSKSTIVVFLFILTTFTATRAAELTDPYEILAQHYEAMGGLEKLKAEKTTYIEGEILLEGTGLQGTFTQWNAHPIRTRQEVDLTIIKQISGDNGQLSWNVDANGKLQIKKDEKTVKARRVKELLARYEHINPASPYFKVSYRGIDTVDARACYVVKITNTVNEDVQLDYYNTMNFDLEKTIEIQPDLEMHSVYSDYRDVQGVKHPFVIKQEVLPIGQKITLRIRSYEVNADVDDALFEPPSQDVKDYRFTHGESAQNIPFQFIENHIYLPINIRGKEKLWVLDSGAGKSVVDLGYATELGLTVEGEIKAMGAGHTVSVSLTTLPPFTIQDLQFSEQKIITLEITPLFRKVLGLDVVGILGYDFLSRFITKIDYAHERISFYEPDKFVYDGNGNVVDAPLVDNMFVVPMTVDEKYSGKWLIDLGADGLSFHYPFAEENSLLDRSGIDVIEFGAGGAFTSRMTKFRIAALADFVTENPIISIPRQKGEGAFAKIEQIGNIGNDLLRHFVLYLDYKNQRVILEQGEDFGKQFPRDKSGLQILHGESGNIEVFSVPRNTPAEKAGFKQGDIIQAMNGVDVNYFDGIVAIRKLLKEKAGTKYTFTVLRNGKTKEITLTLHDLFKE